MYFMIWKLTSLQRGGKLVLRTPFLSSTGCSSGRKNAFLAAWPNNLSSLLQGSLNGRPVTRLMSSRVTSRVKPLKFTVACVFDSGFKDIKNSSVISSSWPWNLSEKDIQFSRVKRSTTSGCSRSLLGSEGSFLINPLAWWESPILCSDQKRECCFMDFSPELWEGISTIN